MTLLTLLVVLGALLIVFIVSLYNVLVRLRVNRESAFADIDVQLKQRFDLIPNLIETVKGYANHEKETLESLTNARTARSNAETTTEKLSASNMLTGALKSLFAVAENYPDLKANQNFLQLQNELSDIENKVAAARRFFNNATKELNTRIQMFPSNIIAQMFQFHEEEFFELTDREKEGSVPEVKF